MKTLIHSLLCVAAAAMTCVSCSKDQTDQLPVESGFKMTFVAGAEQTRTTLGTGDIIQWVAKDLAGVYVNNTALTSINRQASVDITKDPVEFTVSLLAAPAAGDMLYAYYPYIGSAGNDLKAVKASIPTAQTQDQAGMLNGSCNPMAGIPVVLNAGATGSQAMPRVNFRQLGSIVEFDLISTNAAYAAEVVKTIAYSADKALAGDFTYDITAIDATTEPTISGYTETSVTTTMTTPAALGTTKENASKIYMIVAPGEYSGSVVVTTDKAKYTYNIATAKVFKRATVKELVVDLANAASREELPLAVTGALFPSGYNSSEKTFVLDGTTFGYKNCIYNANGTPPTWATKQVIQTKGSIYNKTPLSILKVRVYSINEGAFNVCAGITENPTENQISNTSLTPTKETVNYTKYISGGSTSEATVEINIYEFDLSTLGSSYISVNAPSTVYYTKIEILCGTPAPTVSFDQTLLALAAADVAEKTVSYAVYNGEPTTVSMTQDEASKAWLQATLDPSAKKITYKALSENTSTADRSATLTVAIADGNTIPLTIKQAKPATKLTTPTVTAEAKSTSFTLSWPAVPNATEYGYIVLGADDFTAEGKTSDLTMSFTGLTPETAYDYAIWAIGDGVYFANSDSAEAIATTLAAGTGLPVGTVLWSENWDGGIANATPSAYLSASGSKGTVVYGGASVSYTETSGGSVTKLYKETSANGTAPELLLSKTKGTWTISNIPIADAPKIQLALKSNNDLTTFTSISYSVDGGNATNFEKGSYAKPLLTLSPVSVKGTTLTIVFTGNNGGTNIRIDDVSLVVSE